MWNAFVGLMINILLFIYTLVGNFGVAIILFTILIRLVTHPLMVSQLKASSAQQAMNSNPEWQEIQKKYKDDKEKLAQEQMRMYKQMGINPLSSCLPMLVQLPIIIALYQAVIQALATTPIQLLDLTKNVYPSWLNLANLIPLKNTFLWMNLGQPDFVSVAGIPFGIPILAIIVVVTTFLQTKLMTPPSTNPNDQSSRMMGMMNLYMPFLMGYLAITLASGLSLYFVISNLFTIGQYALLGKVDWRNLLPRKREPEPVVQKGKAPAPVAKKTSAKTSVKKKPVARKR